MGVAFAGLFVVSQVIEAHVAIEVRDNGATVELEYGFAEAVDGVTFDAIRWPGQSVTFSGSAAIDVIDLGGLLRVAPSANAVETFRVGYAIDGNPERIPLLIPNVPTLPGTSYVTIVVRNVSSPVAMGDAFPRFSRDVDGSLRAHPANLPSFVLVPNKRRLSRARIADAVVLSIVIAASGIWVVRRARSPR